jgi:hypothetical protein
MKQDTTYPDNFFDGNWESTSYGCTAEQPTRVMMSATNDLIEAIKLTDADCVEKGHPTLRLAARANYQETGTYPCDVILGYKGNPQSSSSDDCKIIIHDCNNYELKNTYFSLYFKRSEEFPDCKKAFLPETPEQSLPDNCQVKRMVPALKSTDYSVALNVTFINKTGKTVKIIWMDYNGGEVEYNTLKNTMFYTQQTYATHPWIFKIGNKAIGYYTPGFDNENLTEVFIEDPEECNSNNTPAVIKPHEPVGQYPYPVEFFDGDWESESYGCTESQPTRVNMFTNEQGNVEAVKLTDAQCVEKGHATLKFNGKPDYKIPGNYGCEIILGYAGNPQSSSSHDCKIEIVNCNHYKAIHPYFTLDFTRTQEIEFCDKAFPVEEEIDEEEPNVPGIGSGNDDGTEMATEVWPWNYFEGKWKSEDYGCSETKITRFNIKTDRENDQVNAIRLTDSKCVNKGHVLFQFDAREDYTAPGMYNCRFFMGNEKNPQSTSTTDCNIEIVDCNNFNMIAIKDKGSDNERQYNKKHKRSNPIQNCTPSSLDPTDPTVPVNDVDQDQDPVNDDDIKPDPKPEPEDDQEEQNNIDTENYCDD